MGEKNSSCEMCSCFKTIGSWILILIGFVLLSAPVYIITSVYDAPAEKAAKDTVEREAKLVEYRGEAQKKLTTFGYIDKDSGTVRFPIEVAMSKAVEELKDKKPTPAASSSEVEVTEEVLAEGEGEALPAETGEATAPVAP